MERWANHEGMGPFFMGELTPCKTACKYFNFTIGGGMKYVKLLKNGAGKDFIFHAIIPTYILYGENFIV